MRWQALLTPGLWPQSLTGTALGSPHQIPELQVFGAFLYVTQIPDAVGTHFIQALNGNGGALVSALNAHGAVC